MKFFVALSSAALVAASGTPLLQFDPNTTKDCAEWHNVSDGSETCEYVRKLYGITPQEFHEWNPLVGLDCSPWWDWQSYCIVTWKKLDTLKASTTSTVTQPSTTSVATLAPSPTAWTALGCYVKDPSGILLEQNMTPSGDGSLTIPKCKNTCYRRAYSFAGVHQGNQCWCSSFVGGEKAKNETDCNMPCTGDKNTLCGGQGVVNVFQALQNSAPITTGASAMTSTSVGSASSSVGAVKAAPTSNIAMKNRALFGMEF